MTPAVQLQEGLTTLGVSLPSSAQEKLLGYLALLSKWNRTYNLTAVRDEAEMVSRHLLDSLAILPHLGEIDALADVGSGAGLPGLVLALARPSLKVTSIEASQKKAAFQQQVKIELGLGNVSIHCGRVEEYKGVELFPGVISRAFSELSEFIRQAGGLLRAGGRLLAMKGRFPKEELAQLPAGWKAAQTIRLQVPGLVAERHLIVLQRA